MRKPASKREKHRSESGRPGTGDGEVNRSPPVAGGILPSGTRETRKIRHFSYIQCSRYSENRKSKTRSNRRAIAESFTTDANIRALPIHAFLEVGHEKFAAGPPSGNQGIIVATRLPDAGATQRFGFCRSVKRCHCCERCSCCASSP
jgi:hypothetical protein